MNNLDLNIENYELNDILNLFKMSENFTSSLWTLLNME